MILKISKIKKYFFNKHLIKIPILQYRPLVNESMLFKYLWNICWLGCTTSSVTALMYCNTKSYNGLKFHEENGESGQYAFECCNEDRCNNGTDWPKLPDVPGKNLQTEFLFHIEVLVNLGLLFINYLPIKFDEILVVNKFRNIVIVLIRTLTRPTFLKF